MEQEKETRINRFSTVVRSGKRTYFFDVKENKFAKRYLTITESRQVMDEEGNPSGYTKHKVYLHFEDCEKFIQALKASEPYLPNPL